MTPLKAFIVDDEPDACQMLQNLLNDFSLMGVPQTYSDVLKALDDAIIETPDVIFLDISMPEISGLEFLKQLHSYSPATLIVFVSAHRERALEALQNGAFDFIAKPADKNELRRVVHKITVAKYRQATKIYSTNNRVLLKTSEGHHYISPEDVLFLEADGNYTRLFLKEDKKLLSGINLGRLSEQFSKEKFVRISRKHIINKRYLKFMNFHKKQCIVSANGKEVQLEVSVRLKEIKQFL